MIPRRRKALFGLLTNVALLGGIEAGLRVAHIKPKVASAAPVEFVGAEFESGVFPLERDDRTFWRLIPRAKIPDLPEFLNAEGFRGPEFTPAKPPGTKRLVLIGDSNTFGIGVEDDETFAHRLRRWLSTKPESKWEVINTGVPGFSAFQMLRLLETQALAFSPDAVVVYAGAWNDYTPAIGAGDEETFAGIEAARRERERIALSNTRLFGMIRQLLAPAAEKRASSKRQEYMDAWAERVERPDGPRLLPERFRAILETMSKRCREAGAKLIFVTPPVPRATRERFTDGDRYAAIVQEVARARGDGLIDPRALFSAPGETDAQLFCDIVHPTALGHAHIAAMAAAELQRIGVDGIPSTPAKLLDAEPMTLKSLLPDALIEAGTPLTPISSADAAALDPKLIILPVPSRITFKDLRLPPQASLVLDLTLLTRESIKPEDWGPIPADQAKKTGDVLFTVSVDGQVVLQETKSATSENAWAYVGRHRIDLSFAADRPVNLVLEVRGPVKAVGWGETPIYSLR